MHVECACGARLRVRDELAGRNARCPKCGAVLTIPAAPAFAPELPVEPPPDRICPQCGAVYPHRQAACAACKIDLATGRPLRPTQPKPSQRVIVTPKDFDKPRSFPMIVLDTLWRPWKAFEILAGQIGRPQLLVPIVILYVASLSAPVLLGVFGMSASPGLRQEKPPGGEPTAHVRLPNAPAPPPPPPPPPPEPEPPRTPQSTLRVEGAWKVEIALSPDPPKPLEALTLTYRIEDRGSGEPVPCPLQAWLYTGGEGTRLEAAAGADPKTWIVRWPTPWPGEFRVELTPEQIAGQVPPAFEVAHALVVEVEKPPAEEPAAPVGRPGIPEPMSFDSPPAVKTVGAGVLIFFNVVLSVVLLALWTAVLTYFCRLFGGGGGFLQMALVLAYVNGIANLVLLGLVPIGLAAPDWGLYCRWLFILWRFALVLLAVKNVFDLETPLAVGAIVLAALTQWVATFVLGMIALHLFLG